MAACQPVKSTSPEPAPGQRKVSIAGDADPSVLHGRRPEANMRSRKGERSEMGGSGRPADNEKVLLVGNEFE